MQLDGRRIGPDEPPYVIAELSANHLGDRARAFEIVEAAHRAGADAVKLQTYTPDAMTLDLEGPGFSIDDGPWKGWKLYDLYDQAQTPAEWHADLFARGRELGLTVLSSPFDADAVALLEGLDAPAYKIASFELVDHELIACAAATGKPMILSTGMASPEEIHQALAVARGAGCGDLALLHCVSGYPTPAERMNLRAIQTLAGEFRAVVGLSDHSLGRVAPIAALALGARIFEKHLTLRRSDGGPDAGFSLEPEEFETLVADLRCAWSALGHGRIEPSPEEASSLKVRRSLYVVRDVGPGEILGRDSVRAIRPALGLPPRYLPDVLGARTLRALKRGEPLRWDDIEVVP